MRIVFMGSPDFAVPSLERLAADGHTVPLVVTQPDRPAGRGRDLRSPAVIRAAERHRIPLAQPERVGDPQVLAALREAQPEIAVVVAFGQFLPRAVRELPPLGCINVHASLLPKFRGAAPIHRALMAGETETGVTVMRVEEQLDAGPILLQRACPIRPEAHDQGAKVAILEAASEDEGVGNSRFAGGVMRFAYETVEDLTKITGQKPQIRRARNSVSNFKVREDMDIGCRVTLRGKRMYEFVDRLFNAAIPRLRDFRGLNPRSFDGRGNYNMGIADQSIFSEIDLAKITFSQGMNITFVTNARNDEQARALLTSLGLPLRRTEEQQN